MTPAYSGPSPCSCEALRDASQSLLCRGSPGPMEMDSSQELRLELRILVLRGPLVVPPLWPAGNPEQRAAETPLPATVTTQQVAVRLDGLRGTSCCLPSFQSDFPAEPCVSFREGTEKSRDARWLSVLVVTSMWIVLLLEEPVPQREAPPADATKGSRREASPRGPRSSVI